MFRLLRRLAIPAIAAGCVGFGSAAASAESILVLDTANPLPTVTQVGTGQITVTGAFDGPSFISNSALASAYGALDNPLTLTLTDFGDVGSLVGGVQNLATGSFTLTDAGTHTVLAAGNISGATLNVNSSGSILSGTFTYSPGGLESDFAPLHIMDSGGDFSISLGTVGYTVSGGQLSGANAQVFGGGFDAAVAPLPATASTGLALLGGLGVLGGVSVLRRRRQMA
jgi:hypothetical protein